MKKLFLPVALILMLAMLSGCAAFSGSADYDKYLAAVSVQAAEQKPTFSLTCDDPNGCSFGSLEYMDPRDRIRVEQKQPSEWVMVVRDGIKWTGRIILGGIIVDGVSDVISSVASGTTYENSFNSVGRDNTVTDQVIDVSGESTVTTSADIHHDDSAEMVAPEEGGEEAIE